MEIGSRILSDITVYGKYSKFLYDLHRRESYEETVTRNKEMHLERFPHLKTCIEDAYSLVYDKSVLPSMRSLQFGGKAIQKNNARIFNCSFMPINHHAAFAEAMFLLLCGSGVGYSVQRHNVYMLPGLQEPGPARKYLIGDSIEGWADAVRHLMKAYLQGAPRPRFCYDDIRAKGTPLSSGGKAPGPEPLAIALEAMEKLMRDKGPGGRLTPLDCSDLICHASEAVRSGGIRRAALIGLFDYNEEGMLTSKNPENFEYQTANSSGKNPQRARANISAVMLRTVSRDVFDSVWRITSESGSGEPAVYWTNDVHMGTNPCVETGLRNNQFCNLSEINASNIQDQSDYNQRAWAAAVIGTLQATYTDFHYLRPVWKDVTDEEALLGVSMTGIASGPVLEMDMRQAAQVVVDTNEWVARMLRINPAARTTLVKPAGTSSLVLMCSSGVHAWHDDYYLRRMRYGVEEPIAQYLMQYHPELVEPSVEKPGREIIVSVPVKAPDGAITRHDETAMSTLERVKRIQRDWIATGHRSGANRHNVSCTVYVKPDEWGTVGDWMWENREHYNGMACYPYYEEDSMHVQAPFETINREEYERMAMLLSDIDLTNVVEERDEIRHETDSVACAGGACELTAMH